MQSTALIQSRVLECPSLINPIAIAAFAYSENAALTCLGATGDRRRFNLVNCEGKSLYAWDTEIAQTRARWIARAIELQQILEFKYSHLWRGRTWTFRCTVQHFPEFGEVLVQVFDDADWQAQWWANLD